jgi:hypothetical protein
MKFDDLSQLRTTTKRIGRREKYFKTNVLVPKIAVVRKEEGATAAASPTFSAAKQCWLVSQGQNGPRFSTEILFYGKAP